MDAHILSQSSDEKVDKIKKFIPNIESINYKKNTDIAKEVKRLTQGKGADIIVNNTGPAAVTQWQIEALRRYGTLSLVGFLAGTDSEDNAADVAMGLLKKAGTLQCVLSLSFT